MNTDGVKLDVIFCGDNAEYLKTLPGEIIDMTITSPPYDDMRDYTGFSWNLEKLAHELYRITKPGGVVVWIVSDETKNGSETGSAFRQALYFKKIGFNLHDTMIWQKDSFSFPESNRYPNTFEYMFIFSKGKPKTFNPIKDRRNIYAGTMITGTYRQKDGTTTKRSKRESDAGGLKEYGIRHNVWQIPAEKRNTYYNHPAKFPEQLVHDHIVTWSNKGDIVLDPFIGSGTTAVVAIHTGRHYIGAEISPKYCEMARQRIKDQASFVQLDFDEINETGVKD